MGHLWTDYHRKMFGLIFDYLIGPISTALLLAFGVALTLPLPALFISSFVLFIAFSAFQIIRFSLAVKRLNRETEQRRLI